MNRKVSEWVDDDDDVYHRDDKEKIDEKDVKKG